MDALVAELCAE